MMLAPKRKIRGGTISVGAVKPRLFRLSLSYSRIVFALNTLNPSNISFTRFRPPLNENTFCRPMSRSLIAPNRTASLRWNSSSSCWMVVASPSALRPPKTSPGPSISSTRTSPSLTFRFADAVMSHGNW